MSKQPLAVVRSVDELQAALRARALALRIVFDGRSRRGDDNGRDCSLDGIAGLPTGYAAKLLAPVPLKSFGRHSLGPMLTALGCKLLLVEDADLLERITKRIERDPKANGRANATMPTRKSKNSSRKQWRGNSKWGKILRARGLLLVPEGKRKQIARTAANARWRGRSTNADDKAATAARSDGAAAVGRPRNTALGEARRPAP